MGWLPAIHQLVMGWLLAGYGLSISRLWSDYWLGYGLTIGWVMDWLLAGLWTGYWLSMGRLWTDYDYIKTYTTM